MSVGPHYCRCSVTHVFAHTLDLFVQLDEEDKYSGVIREEDLARMRAAHHAHHHAPPHHSASTSALPSHTQQNGAAAAGQSRPVPWRSSTVASHQGPRSHPQHMQQQQPAAPQLPPGLAGASIGDAAQLGAPPGLPVPGSVSAPVSIPARPSASGSSSGGGGGLPGSAHGSSPAAAWAGAAGSLDVDARKEANKVMGMWQ